MQQTEKPVHVARWGADATRHAPLTASNELLSDSAGLRQRMRRDGYLYLRGLLDPALLDALRGDILGICGAHGWLDPHHATCDGITQGPAWVEGYAEYFTVYDAVQRLEPFHRLKHHAAITAAVGRLFDEPLFPHPLAVCRLVFPNVPDESTPPHQDYPNNQGSVDTYAVWIPLSPCPRELGNIAVLEGSHRFGLLPMRASRGAGYRTTMPRPDLEALRWVSSDIAAGDVLLFHSLTVHRALGNRTDRLRVSVDYRYSSIGQPVSDAVLRPHFGRLDWAEIYRGWQSNEGTYYWRDLPLHVVPYEVPPPVDPLELAQAAQRTPAPSSWLQRVGACLARLSPRR